MLKRENLSGIQFSQNQESHLGQGWGGQSPHQTWGQEASLIVYIKS